MCTVAMDESKEKVGLVRVLFSKAANVAASATLRSTTSHQEEASSRWFGGSRVDESRWVIVGEDSLFRMHFRDHAVEKVYRKTVHKHNIREGVRMLLLFIVFLLLAILLDDDGKYFQDVDCKYTLQQRDLTYNITWCLVMIVLAAFNLRIPRLGIYVPLLAGFYTTFLVIDFIQSSCDRSALIDRECIAAATSTATVVTRNLRDCSKVGATSILMLMTVILMSPHFVPRLELMHLLWIWLACILCKIWETRPYVGKEEPRFRTSEFGGQDYYTDVEIFGRMAILTAANILAVTKKSYLVKSQRKKFIDDRRHMEASHKIHCVLECMVPYHVIAKLIKNPHSIIAEPCSKVSILFIMIVDFDQYARKLSPKDLLEFLNTYFQQFDNICQDRHVTKVETVSEEYVAAVGVVPEDKAEQGEDGAGHSVVLGRLIQVATDIFLTCQGNRGPSDMEVKFKMGVHTGPVVAGVIGNKLPRFRLFGDTINTAARMMQKGLAGNLQMGEDTRQHLPDTVRTVARGPIEMKGKGMVETFLLDVAQMPQSQGSPHSQSSAAGLITSFAASGTLSSRRFSVVDCATVALADEGDGPFGLLDDSADKSTVHERSPRGDASVAAPRMKLPSSALRSKREPGSTPLLRGAASTVSSVRWAEDAMASPRARELELAEVGVAASGTLASSRSMTSGTVSHASSPRTRWRRTTRFDRCSTATTLEGLPPDEQIDMESAAQESRREGLVRFRKTLDEVSHDSHDEDGKELPISKRVRMALGIDMESFAPEEEEKWLRWFHETVITKKFAHRAERDLFYVSSFFAITTFLMIYTDAGSEWHALYAEYRFEACLVANLIIVIVSVAWWLAADSEWLVAEPATVQARLLMTTILVVCCLFVILEALSLPNRQELIFLETLIQNASCWTGDGHFDSGACDIAGAQETLEIKSVEDMIDTQRCSAAMYSLIYVLLYFMVTTSHAFRVSESLFYFGTAVFVILVNEFRWPPKVFQESQFHRHDQTRFFAGMYFSRFGAIVFVSNSLITCMLAFTTERNSRARYKALTHVESTRERIESILHTLMPEHVIEELSELEPTDALPSHSFGRAIIAQSDLCGFTKLASTRPPSEVIQFISEIFGRFDALTDRYDVYKVETVGDAYIAGQAGWPLTRRSSAICVVRFGLDMVTEVHRWSHENGEEVSCRVGVHLGSCIGGIVGVEMQRYHLFGGLMSALELLESTSEQGKVQVSTSCREAALAQMRQEGLNPEALQFDERTEPHLATSKGDIVHYDEVGGHTYIARGNPAMLRDFHGR